MEQYMEQALQSVITSKECKLCSVNLSTASVTKQHCASKSHKNNVAIYLEQLKTAKQEFLSSWVNQKNQQGILQKKNEKTVTETVPRVNQDLYCSTCCIQTVSKEQMWNHLKKATHHLKAEELGHPQINGTNTPFYAYLPKELKDQMLVDICHICSNSFSTVSQALDHYGSSKHDAAVRRWFKQKRQTEKSEKNSGTKSNGTESNEIKQDSKTTERFYCYPCKMYLYSKAEKDKHVQDLPHALVVKLKSALLKEGIVDEYWSIHGSRVDCLLCSRMMCGSPGITPHINSSKHWDNYNNWYKNLSQLKVAVDVRWYYCKICDKDLDGTSGSEGHYANSLHSKKSMLYCYICKVSNATPELLEAHKSSSLHMEMLQKSQNPIPIREQGAEQTGSNASVKSSDSGTIKTQRNRQTSSSDSSPTPEQLKEETDNITADLKSLGKDNDPVSSQQVLENALYYTTGHYRLDANISNNSNSIDESSTTSSTSTLNRNEENKNIPAGSKSLEISSSSTNTKKLKEQVFNQLELLVQKLYYSKTVPYEVALDYLKRMNTEVDQLSKKHFSVSTVNVSKQHASEFGERIYTMNRKGPCAALEESGVYTDNAENVYAEQNVANFIPETEELPQKHVPSPDNHGILNSTDDKTGSLQRYNSSVTINTENGENKKEQNISDLIRNVMERKREVAQDDRNENSLEKELLNEMEIFLRQIEGGGIPLEEILRYLESVNQELQMKDFAGHEEMPTGDDEIVEKSGEVKLKNSEEVLPMRTCENVDPQLRPVVNDTDTCLSDRHSNDCNLTHFQGCDIDLYYSYYFDNNFNLFRMFSDVYLQGSPNDWLNMKYKP